MTRVLLLILLALALGASAAYYIRADAGYVLLSYGGWSLETSLLGFTVALGLLLLAFKYGLSLLLAGLRLPRTLRQSVDRRRERRARESFERGLQQWAEARWAQAEVEFVRRAADHSAHGLNYFFAADAARRLGAADRSERYLQQAEDGGQGSAAWLARAALATARQDWPAAREWLLRLHEREPTHEALLERLCEVHAAAGDWDALHQLLNLAPMPKALPAPQRDAWQRRLAQGRLDAALAAARLDQFKAAWESFAPGLRAEPALRRRHIEGLMRLNAEAEGAALIVAALREGWDDELVSLYGRAQGLDPLAALAQVEQWLGQFGEKPTLLWLAAIACERNKLWGKARSYLDALLRVAPAPAAYLALARLSEQAQNPDEAARHWRKGLELAVDGAR